MTTKPPYRVPTMAEIRDIPWNGLTVASTFAGGGGSSTGYRMAGYRVLWANEFVPAAQDSYRANMDGRTILDGRDIKVVQGAEILKACGGLRVGELDVFDGSPPCQAFSSAGRREKGWGTERRYDHGAEQLNEELFFDYIRLRDELQPRAFIAENVAGLVKGAAKGFFLEILAKLSKGYRVKAAVLDAQWLGVPQQRSRVIFVGVREDLERDPVFPKPLPYRYSIRDALPHLARVTHDTGGTIGLSAGSVAGRPAPPITVGHANYTHFKVEDALIVRGQQAGKKFAERRRSLNRPAPAVQAEGIGSANRSQYRIEVRKVGLEEDVGDHVAPTIEGYAVGAEYAKLNPGEQSGRFFSLVRPDAGEPCPAITACGGGEGAGAPGSAAAVCHPTEARKFTIAELKAICSFPADYVLTGSYAEQWARLGNSVPPLMMFQIASTLRDKVLSAAKESDTLRSRNRNGSCAERLQKGSGRKSTSAARTNVGHGRHLRAAEGTGISGSTMKEVLSRRTSSHSKKK